MEELRTVARAYLDRVTSDTIPDFIPNDIAVSGDLELLWNDISSKPATGSLQTCENLLVAQGYLRLRNSSLVSEHDHDVANNLYEWASISALPSSEFAETPDPEESLDDEKRNAIKESRLTSTLAISVIAALDALLPISKANSTADIIVALASFTSEQDPWTTKESFSKSTALLEAYVTSQRAEKGASSLWSVVECILKERIRPLFAKTKNPAITAAGRKNFHPVPLPRFDASVLDPTTKPWKIRHVYAPTVFAWVLAQYRPTDIQHLESDFPLLIPPLLALIDDDSLPFKTLGCTLLSHLLIPIRESASPILRRTNLSSVFEEAVTPCLLSLPTITPEPDSLRLLGAAYPALLSLLKTTYPPTPHHRTDRDRDLYLAGIANLLRAHLVPSFHHVSSTNPTSEAFSSFASFPYPRLSTFLMHRIAVTLTELRIHATRYLQEVVPLVYSTLANPFGTAYPPLLMAGVAVARAVVVNAHPRLWWWRGELLGAVCSCWIHVLEEEREKKKKKGDGGEEEEGMVKLKKGLKGVVYLLKLALANPVRDGDPGQVEAKENIGKEMQELVDADEDLRELLLGEVDLNDGEVFAG